MKTRLSFLVYFMLLAKINFGQIEINFENTLIIGEKCRELELILPVEVEIKNLGSDKIEEEAIISFDKSRTIGNNPTQISDSDFSKIEIRNNILSFKIESKKEKIKTFYIFVNKEVSIKSDKVLHIDFEIRGTAKKTIQIKLKRGNDITYTLSDYMSNDNLKINPVSKVESNNNLLTIYGIRNNNISKIDVQLEPGNALAIWEWSSIFNAIHWTPIPLSLTTVPFKIRPELTLQNGSLLFEETASSGLSNIGFNLDLAKIKLERYFSTGKKSTHKLSLGFWAAPSVEEMDSDNTLGYLAVGEKSKQLFLSTGVTIAYSYNDISFIFIPRGWDLNTSTIGDNWIYDNEPWWGFGIAVSPKIFASVLNK